MVNLVCMEAATWKVKRRRLYDIALTHHWILKVLCFKERALVSYSIDHLGPVELLV